MKQNHGKRVLACGLAAAMMLSTGSAMAAQVQGVEDPNFKVTIDGKDVTFQDVNGKPVSPIIVDGTTYLPVRAVSEANGLKVDWDGTSKEVKLSTNGDSVTTELCFASTTYGNVMGYNWQGVDYFYGIPYAKAQRFHMPEAPDAWTGYRTCMMQGEVAPQNKTTMEKFDFMAYSREMVENEETCLNLNVMTTNTGSKELKPVVFWIHGGGYTTGGSLEKTVYDGGNIADFGDVVFVSVNHRLNCLGYLDLSAYGDEYKNSGNAGMADLVFALEWVRDNVANFGGDPNNVTIVGQSGGGSKVTTLMGMPAAQGLFHKAMAISGGSAKVTRTTESARAETEKVLSILGITAENIKDIETVDYRKLYAACTEAGVSYGPVVDGDYYPTGTYEMSKDIPFMCGNVLGEFSTNIGNIIFMTYAKEAIEGNILTNISEADVVAKLTEQYEGDADRAAKVVAAYKEAYPGHNVAEVLYINNRSAGMSSYPLAEAMASYGGTVYQYVQACPYPMFGGIVPIHTASDIPMWFHNDEMIPAWTAGDEATFAKLSDEMAGALCAFAKTGSPNQSNLPWEPWTAENDAMMVFDHESGVRYHHEDALFEAMGAPKGGFPF